MESLEGVPALCRADRLVLLRGRGKTNLIKDIPVVLNEEAKDKDKKKKRKRLLKWIFPSDTEDDDFIVEEQTGKKKVSKRNNNTGDKSSGEESSSAKRRNLRRQASFASQVLPDQRLKGATPCLKGGKGKHGKVKKFLFPRSDSCDDSSPSQLQEVKGKGKTVSPSLPRKRSIIEDSESDSCGPSVAAKRQKSMFWKSKEVIEDRSTEQGKTFKFPRSNDSCRDMGSSCGEPTKILPKCSSGREKIVERNMEDSSTMPDNSIQLGRKQNTFDEELEDDATHYAGKVNDGKNTSSNDKVHQKSSEIPSLDIDSKMILHDTRNTITSLQEFVKMEKDGMSLPDGYGSDKLAQVLIFLLEEKVRVSTSHSERDLFRKTIHTLLCGGCKDKEKHNKVRCKRCDVRERKKDVNKDPDKQEIKNDKKDQGEKKPKVSITLKVTEAPHTTTLPSYVDKLPISTALPCELCEDLFEQKEDLNAHAETPHIRECLRDGCGKKFVNLSGLIKHTFNKHKTYESNVDDGALQETTAEEVLDRGKDNNTLNSKDDKEVDREKVFGGDDSNEYNVGFSVLNTSQVQPLFEDELDTEVAENTKDFNPLHSKYDTEIDREKVFGSDEEYNVEVSVLNTSQFQPLFEDELDTEVAKNPEMVR